MEDILFNKNFTCIAVSKTKPVEDIKKIYNLGHKDFGENKVQELELKFNSLPKDINWHMIGHLQTNKVKKVVPLVSLIHSVDSLKLLKTINKESIKINKVTDCLIQINISNEDSKYGFKVDEIDFLNKNYLNDYQNIKIRGLMGMASFSNEINSIKKEFILLKRIFDELKKKLPDFNILSMGMSNDYKIALKTGSNMIRIGSKIFGSRNYH
jgi:pyridoxal phosphate enzyme (YggS family)